MTRTIFFIILGLIMTVTVGVLAFVILQAGNAYIEVVDPNTPVSTLAPVTVTPATPTSRPSTATATAEATDTPDLLPTTTATALSFPGTTSIAVLSTEVQYVYTHTDVNIRNGPGTSYRIVGWVAGDQTARVTGVSSDGGWWRVICPDDSVGSCWVTARPQFTEPSSPPGNTATPTSAPTACTDRAALIADVTVPDGARILPNSGFDKIWRIKNTGTCTWDGRYRLVHAGGHFLGAVSPDFPLPDTVLPGESIDLVISMVSPDRPDTYQSDWKLQNPEGQFFGVGRNNGPFWVKILVLPAYTSVISGVVYEDANENGVYDGGEPLVAGREIRLFPGTACHVLQTPLATARSDGNGYYALRGNYSGSYCVGLAGDNGLDDVASVTVIPGHALETVHLRAPLPSGSISGYVWNDYCLVDEIGTIIGGDCVPDDGGSYRADSVIQPAETYISGAVIALQPGACANNHNPYTRAVTGNDGRYFFGSLMAGTYCVSVDITFPENQVLLPGDWTFPALGINHHQLTLVANENAYPVNFGWDYQLK